MKKNLVNHLTTKRECFIVLTVVLGMVLSLTIPHIKPTLATVFFDHTSFYPTHKHSLYYTNYILGFVISFLVSLAAYSVILTTASLRLLGLMVFILIDMILNILVIIDVDFYHLIKPYRYTNTINFTDTYYYYELLCIILFFIKSCLNYNFSNVMGLRNTFTNGNSFIHRFRMVAFSICTSRNPCEN